MVSKIISSKQSDAISLIETINKMPIDINTLKNSTHNRYKQHMLADSGYDSNLNKNYLRKKGYIPIIAPNIKNTKKKQLIKQKQLTKKGKEK